MNDEVGGPPIRAVLANADGSERQVLRRWLRSQRDIELVGSRSDGPSAVRLIRRLKPDLAVIHVQLPRLDGFGVLAALDGSAPRAVIFVADHPAGAVQAFQERITDFLLQPLSRVRFEQALERARLRLRRPGMRSATGTLAVPKDRRHVTIRVGGNRIVVNPTDIRWIRAKGSCSEIQLSRQSILSVDSLGALELSLAEAGFVRINRSVLVHRDHIRESRPKSHGDHWVTLTSGEPFVLSRTYRKQVLQALGF